MKSLFYKPIKLKHPSEDVFFTADLHCRQECASWDSPLWKRRGYNSIEEHYEGVIKKWNSVVTPSSIVFNLGDMIFQKDGEKWMMDLFRRLNFHHMYLCRGNHGSGWDKIFESLESNILQIGDKTVVFCPNYFEAVVNSQPVVLSHYFIASWNGQNSSRGASFCLHGHSHQSLLNGELADYISRVRAMDVGIDATGYPFSFKEIYDKLIKIKPYSPDHHDGTTSNAF
jgi:calcineurin-like phosphoesterase family protein